MADWGETLAESFYDREAHGLAEALLGQVLVGEVGGELVAGRLVEVEVYGGVDDAACHADRGLTERTRSMFGDPGISYVYQIYGMYHCFNVVAPRGQQGKAAAILVRAIEPLAGLEVMKQRRATQKVVNLTSGPGKICQAYAIDRGLDGHRLAETPLRLCAGDVVPAAAIERTARIGLNPETCGGAANFPWRYVERGNAHLSR